MILKEKNAVCLGIWGRRVLFDRVLKIVRFAWVSKLTVSCLTGYLGCWVLFAWVFRFGLTGYLQGTMLFDWVSAGDNAV